MKRYLLTIKILLLFSNILSAQQSTSTMTAGGKATGATGSTTYSIGELVIPNNTGPGGSVGSGTQNPFEISIVTALPRIDLILVASVFPNPATSSVQLKIADPLLNGYTYFLYDVFGNMLKTAQVKDQVTSIELINYPKGIYILQLQNKGRQTTTFRIIKAQ